MRRVLPAVLLCAACGEDLAARLENGTDPVYRSTIGATGRPRAWDAPPAPPVKRGLAPVSGGTLLVTGDGSTVVAADSENDTVWFTDVGSHAVTAVTLSPADEPGRVVEDNQGLLHVVLRRGGAIITLQRTPAPAAIMRRAVCAEPRGLAFDPSTAALFIACTDGQLLTMPAASGSASPVIQLADDLRDVVLSGSDIVISRFREPELLTLGSGGTVTTTQLALGPLNALPPNMLPGGPPEPGVLWRTLGLPGGGLLVAHQQASASGILLSSGGPDGGGFGGNAYGGFCTPIVSSTVSLLMPGQPEVFSTVQGALPVDIAVSAGGTVAIVTAGDNNVMLAPLTAIGGASDGGQPDGGTFFGGCDTLAVNEDLPQMSQPIAVAFIGEQAVVQVRAPAGLVFNGGGFVPFPVTAAPDLGHTLFHTQTPSGLACASCHPEGRDDGHVFQFVPDGPRRTQNLTGGLLATAPFHWDGAFNDIGALMDEVLVNRMGASPPTAEQRVAVAAWLDTLPRPAARPAADAASAQRGQALFESTDVGCTACHSGPRFTNNTTVDVGTGGMFQVPSLTGVVARAPYLHSGCAATLEDRFGACGGGDSHGRTSQLTPQQVGDLVAYLKTL